MSVKRKVTKRKSKKIGGKKASSKRKSTARRRASHLPPMPMGSSGGIDDIVSSLGMNAFSTVGPMALSYAITKIKNYRESKLKAKDLAAAIDKTKRNPFFTKAQKDVKDGILLFVAQSKDPYAFLKVKPTDSQLYINLVAKKTKLFAPKAQKPFIDAALAYIKIKRSNAKNIADLKNLIV